MGTVLKLFRLVLNPSVPSTGLAVSTLKNTKPRKFAKETKAKTSGMFLEGRQNFSHLAEVCIIILPAGINRPVSHSPRVPLNTGLVSTSYRERLHTQSPFTF